MKKLACGFENSCSERHGVCSRMRHIAQLKRTLNSVTRYYGEVRGQAVEIGNLNEHRSEQKCAQQHDTAAGGVDKLIHCAKRNSALLQCQNGWCNDETSVQQKLNDTKGVTCLEDDKKAYSSITLLSSSVENKCVHNFKRSYLGHGMRCCHSVRRAVLSASFLLFVSHCTGWDGCINTNQRTVNTQERC